MKLLSKLSVAAFGIAVLGAITSQAHAQATTAYAIANYGTSLIRFDIANPTTSAVLIGNFNGPGALDAIDFRPLNGQLYGYLDSTDTLYSINLNTAALTVVGSGASKTNSNLLGIDFNPTIDRVRVVTDADDNVVYNPANGTTADPGANNSLIRPLSYATGDVGNNTNFGNPSIIENAYTNSYLGSTPTSTVQYGIDYARNSLVTIANNAGTLNTVGSLGITINNSLPLVGFDIYTSGAGVNTAYGIFDTTAGSAPTLYTVNLGTGAATSLGSIGGFTGVYSLAVTPNAAAAAPEPGSIALALIGAGALTGRIVIRHRRKTA